MKGQFRGHKYFNDWRMLYDYAFELKEQEARNTQET